MSTLAEFILVALLNIAPPGESAHSQVPIAYCDKDCETAPLCEEPTFRCKKPRFDSYIFYSKVDEVNKNGLLTKEQAEALARPYSFTRPETYEEGLARYRIIAEAIDKASKKLTKKECLNSCTSDTKACTEQCKKAPWHLDQRHLAFLIATLIKNESGLRADIHGGLPPNGKGDCVWTMPNGKRVKPGTKGAFKIFETCQSVCLGQVKNVAIKAHNLPYKLNDLTGIDAVSTEKCLTVVGLSLIGAKGMCSGMAPKTDWAAAAFSLYGTGKSCNIPELNSRAHTFWSIVNSNKSIDETLQERINNSRSSFIYNILYSSSKQIKHVPEFYLQEKQTINAQWNN